MFISNSLSTFKFLFPDTLTLAFESCVVAFIPTSVTLFSIVIFVIIVLLRMQDRFEFIIKDLLHRDLTFTGRTLIWDYAIKNIKNNLLFGIGIYDYKMRRLQTGVYHAHCTYLNVLFENGIIGAISYLLIFIKVGNKLMENKSNSLVNMVSYFFFIYFIITLMEVYMNNVMLYILLAVGYNISIILDDRKEKVEDEKNWNSDNYR